MATAAEGLPEADAQPAKRRRQSGRSHDTEGAALVLREAARGPVVEERVSVRNAAVVVFSGWKSGFAPCEAGLGAAPVFSVSDQKQRAAALRAESLEAASHKGPPPVLQEGAELQDPAVETAEEAKEPAEADINELCKDMFSKMATYLTGELTATSEDYKLLENMNKLTSLKYLEMKDIAINISRNLKDLNQKYAALQPYLEQINLIEEQVAALEQAAYKLDAYSKRLEAKYKKLEKR